MDTWLLYVPTAKCTLSDATISSTRKSFVSLATTQFSLHPTYSPMSLALNEKEEIHFYRMHIVLNS